MVEQNECHHRLNNGYTANSDTWVMAPFRDDVGLFALLGDGFARCQNR